MGWAGKRNGDLLRLAQHEFDIFLTADQKMPAQQNLASFKIGIIVLAAKTNRLSDIEPLVPRALEAMLAIPPGTAAVVR